uniref:protein diaphanous homolog 2-like isoform X2 n=1 Tax=Myxine glutinosa TaxID=7769 RepID=UPI00358FCA35
MQGESISPVRRRRNKPSLRKSTVDTGDYRKSTFMEKLSVRQGIRKERPSLKDMSEPTPASSSPFLTGKELSEKEVLTLFEKMMEDLNLTEEKKGPLREKELAIKREIVVRYVSTSSNSGDGNEGALSSQGYLQDLRSIHTNDRLLSCLGSLRVSLNSNPVSWVENFGKEGFQLLLKRLNDLQHSKRPDLVVWKSQHEIIRCLKAFMNNKFGIMCMLESEDGIPTLTRAVNPSYTPMMVDAVKLLSALSIIEYEKTYQRILAALTDCSEQEQRERFGRIIEGLAEHQGLSLKVACMQFINALVTSPDELEFRVHLRSEFLRCGLRDLLPSLQEAANEELEVQLRVFEDAGEDDRLELSHHFQDVRIELDNVQEVFTVISNLVKGSPAAGYLLSLLQHLLLIRNDFFARTQYYRLVDECVSQIVLHRGGSDPDFRHGKRFHLDVDHLIECMVERAKLEESEKRAEELSQKLDAEVASRLELQAELVRKETKERELEALLAQKASVNVTTDGPPAPPDIGANLPIPSPPQPPPLPPPFGVPPPPPLPPGGCIPPPPPPFGGLAKAKVIEALPHGLKPKKEYKLDVPMKRINWVKIPPNKMAANCFWVGVKEEQLEKPELFANLTLNFAQAKGKKDDEADGKKASVQRRKVKELKILDGKTAQNLSIFLGSFRICFDEIKEIIVSLDEERTSEVMVQSLLQQLPEQEQMDSLAQLRSDYDNLSEPEQFGIVLSSIRRLRPRLSCILFRLQFQEQAGTMRPAISTATTACEEVQRSKSLHKILTLALLIGNFMNAGSRHGQAFGFQLEILSKLRDTKSMDHSLTLLHMLVSMCEKHYTDCLRMPEEIAHVEGAAKVSADNLKKSLVVMERQIQQVENEIKVSPAPDGSNDKFVGKMTDFLKTARDTYSRLDILQKNLVHKYKELTTYFAIDPSKVEMEELFGSLSEFRCSFQQAVNENVKRRETEEKIRRAQQVRERAEKERREKQQRRKNLQGIDGAEHDATGVMDNLMEALQTGEAFRERRKRTFSNEEDRKAGVTLERSRSRTFEPVLSTTKSSEHPNPGKKAKKQGRTRTKAQKAESSTEAESLFARLRKL